MLVSHRKQFIYTKTRKTAGTSVEVYFEKYCLPEGAWTFSHGRAETISPAGIIGYRGSVRRGEKTWWNHMPAKDIRRLLGEDVWQRYFKFCVVRSPFDKLVSAFHFFHRMRPPETVKGGDKAHQKDVLVDQFRIWLRDLDPAFDRDTYLIDGRLALDQVIRYEHLKDDIRAVCERLDLPFDPRDIPVLKAGIRDRSIPVCDYFDEKSLALVETRYRYELSCFGYDRPIT